MLPLSWNPWLHIPYSFMRCSSNVGSLLPSLIEGSYQINTVCPDLKLSHVSPFFSALMKTCLEHNWIPPEYQETSGNFPSCPGVRCKTSLTPPGSPQNRVWQLAAAEATVEAKSSYQPRSVAENEKTWEKKLMFHLLVQCSLFCVGAVTFEHSHSKDPPPLSPWLSGRHQKSLEAIKLMFFSWSKLGWALLVQNTSRKSGLFSTFEPAQLDTLCNDSGGWHELGWS